MKSDNILVCSIGGIFQIFMWFIFLFSSTDIFINLAFTLLSIILIISIIIRAFWFSYYKIIKKDELLVFQGRGDNGKEYKIEKLISVKEKYNSFVFFFEFERGNNVNIMMMLPKKRQQFVSFIKQLADRKRQILKDNNAYITFKLLFEREEKF